MWSFQDNMYGPFLEKVANKISRSWIFKQAVNKLLALNQRNVEKKLVFVYFFAQVYYWQF